MKKLIYVPLEPLQERYTVQLSAAKIGWLESRWIEAGVDYLRIEGEKLTDNIKYGTVLDANGRGYWALSQVRKLLQLLDAGEITSEDVIYFDDFWHPGISALPYSFHLMKVKPKMFAMLHAQSVDIHDFTFSMRNWMRHFEIGIGKVLDGIFVTSTCLRDMLLYAGIGDTNTVHICGLPYNSTEVKTHFTFPVPSKKNQVVFSSRWDIEKCPHLFIDIVDYVLERRQDINFVVTTSAQKLRSNSEALLNLLKSAINRHPRNLELRANQTKEQYYHTLQESKIQINTADQDFVSWTLLESTTAGCIPVYPYFLSFPEALDNNTDFMYLKGDAADAARKIMQLIDSTYPKGPVKQIYKKYDKSWERMLHVMKEEEYENLYSN